MSENTDDDREPRFCAPVDFGLWHITIDRETTLCGAHEVEEHHISGTVGDYDPEKDCEDCAKKLRDLRPDHEREIDQSDWWVCSHCGRSESDEPPHTETELADGEIIADVTCETVYLMRDDGYGIGLDYDEFERVVSLFRDAQSALDRGDDNV